MDKADLSVGMPVKVTSYGRTYDGTVTKIGRLLVTITYGTGYATGAQFRIDDRHLNDRNYGSNTGFCTLPQWELGERKAKVSRELRELGLSGSHHCKASLETLEKVVAILKEDASNVVVADGPQ